MQVVEGASGGDAEASSVGEKEFDCRLVGRSIGADLERKEGDGGRGRGRRLEGLVASSECSLPSVEGRFCEPLLSAELADGKAAALPPFEDVAPELLFAGITGFALAHGNTSGTG
jgi:hypothetical protein